MLALHMAIAEERPGFTKPENPRCYNPASYGACEEAVQEVSGHIMALNVALGANLVMPIEEDHPIIEWLIAHAAFPLLHFSVGQDSMMLIKRLAGRKWVRPLAEPGEIVLAKLAAQSIGYGKRRAQKDKLDTQEEVAV